MMSRQALRAGRVIPMVTLFLLVCAGTSQATIPGITGPTFNLTAKDGYISTPDGNSIYCWGYANGAGPMQYVGPTLIVSQGTTVTVNLTNQLYVPTSIVFPGQEGVVATGGTAGLLTQEGAAGGGTVSYTFPADHPGTYLYHSGTDPQLQVEMGLVGAIIVRPSMGANYAYNHQATAFDHEYLFVETEMDPTIHELVETGRMAEVDNDQWWPANWFLNGRCALDTLLPDFAPLLPNQPYNCLPRLHPGENILLRFINAGRDLHPFHPHGNNIDIIARDGRMLSSAPPGAGPDLTVSNFTITLPPGGTADCLFTWTGERLGWDMYGHQHDIDNPPTGNFPGAEDVDHDGDGGMDVVPLEPNEYGPDHGKPFPVILPNPKELTFGPAYSGSPFLGASGFLPPGEGGFNVNAGYFYMWHSHKEKEIVNNNIFPGGMMTMLIVEPPGVPIP